MHSIEYSSQGVWVAKVPQPSEWTNFPHATVCVWLNEMMAKSFWRRYDINNLTQDYRKEKEQSRETMPMALEQ